MISERIIGGLGNFLRFESFLFISCLSYDDSRFQLRVRKSKIQNFLFLLNSLHLYSYALLNAYDLGHHVKTADNHSSAVGDMFFLLVYGINRTWGGLTQTQIWTHRNEIIFYFNCLTEFSRRFFKDVSSCNMKKVNSVNRWMYFAICYYKCLTAVGLILIPGIVLMKPSASYFLYHRFVPTGEFVTFYVLLSLLIEMYSVYSAFLPIVMDEIAIFTIHVLYSGSVLSTLNDRQSFISTVKKTQTYTQLNLISILFAKAVGMGMAIFYSMFGCMWMMGVVGLLKLHGVINIAEYGVICVMSFAGGIVLFGTIHFSGNIPVKCDILLDDLKFNYEAISTNMQRKVRERKSLSLRPFGIQAKPVRVLRHKTIYLYFGSMLSCIVTFLVAFPNLQK